MSKLYIIFKSWWVGDKISNAEGDFSFNWQAVIIVIIIVIFISLIFAWFSEENAENASEGNQTCPKAHGQPHPAEGGK